MKSLATLHGSSSSHFSLEEIQVSSLSAQGKLPADKSIQASGRCQKISRVFKEAGRVAMISAAITTPLSALVSGAIGAIADDSTLVRGIVGGALIGLVSGSFFGASCSLLIKSCEGSDTAEQAKAHFGRTEEVVSIGCRKTPVVQGFNPGFGTVSQVSRVFKQTMKYTALGAGALGMFYGVTGAIIGACQGGVSRAALSAGQIGAGGLVVGVILGGLFGCGKGYLSEIDRSLDGQNKSAV